MDFVSVITTLVWVLTIIVGIHTVYITVVALFFLKKAPKYEQYEPKNRYAAIIAARNEEDVIGNLVESLKLQNYPADLLDIIVIPNNCTDHTKEVAQKAGATVIECPHRVKSKGEVLSFIFDHIFSENDVYDAFCVFDADNVVHPDFMREMNNVLCSGIKIAQGYRDSKNPSDSFISSCYSIYYWAVNRFYNHARSALGMSAMVNGSGFMVSADVIKSMGGWHTVTMTEDIEFTTQCALRGYKIGWASEAIIYDEQPLTFMQSWKQRKRWSTGVIQGMETYTGKLLKAGFKNKNVCCFDMVLFYLSPIMQVLFFLLVILAMWLNITYILFYLFPFVRLGMFQRIFLAFNLSYIFAAAMSCIVVMLAHKKVSGMTKGVFTFWIFIFSWIPINIICLFKRQKTWEEIKHSSDVKITDVTEVTQIKA